MFESEFCKDFALLLEKHGVSHPHFSYGKHAFDPKKPKIWYSGPDFGVEELVAAAGALVEGKWSVAGSYVNTFERGFSRFVGQADSVMANSGSSADLLMVAAAKKIRHWKDGEEIIVSPAGFPTTISGIILNGMKPVFVDIEMETLNFDLGEIEKILKGENRVVSILISPGLGNPPDMDRLKRISERYKVDLLLDGCDSLGTKWKGESLDSYCLASTCSFFPAHHISTLQGGMISSDNQSLIDAARSMATWGRDCYCKGAGNMLPNGTCGQRFFKWLKNVDAEVDHRYVYATDRAYNLLPLDMQGAIGMVQLEKVESMILRRDRAFSIVSSLFDTFTETVGAESYPEATVSWFGVPRICKDNAYKKSLVAHLESKGIQTRNYFAGNILSHPGYEHLGDAAAYPNANSVLEKVFFVGCPSFYTKEHFEYIENTLGDWHFNVEDGTPTE